MRDVRVLTPYMLMLMRQIANGRNLGSDGGVYWLYEVDESQPTFEQRWRIIRHVSDEIAARLVLGGWVKASGTLTDRGRLAARAATPAGGLSG